MERGVAVTGMGIISAIGTTISSNLESLLASESGISSLEFVDSKHATSIKVGEVKTTNQSLAEALHLQSNHTFTRTALLGAVAAREALKSAKISDIQEYKTGLISATTVGGMDVTEAYWNQFASNPETLQYIDSHHCGDSTDKIAAQVGITEFTTTISTACSSAANAIMLGARLIKVGKLDRVIVGGTDALSKFTINGFKSLMLLSETDCKPFDANRNGLNLGEAAAYLVLEADSVVKTENKKPLAYLSGYANANDAHHQTASSPEGEGAYLAMQQALKIAGLQPQDIDYMNAHGTATPNNDLSESVAILRMFGSTIPSLSSTKGFTGHTLAAAGAIEAVFSILALQQQKVFPNLNFREAMPETGLIPVTTLQSKKLKHVASNSFGFGGNCSCLIFSAV